MLRLKHCGWQGSMADVELMSMLDQLFQAITGTGTVLTIISVISFHHLFTIKSHDDQPTYCPGLCRKGSRKRQVQGERLGKNYSRRSWGSWCWEGRDIDFMIRGLETIEASYTQWYVQCTYICKISLYWWNWYYLSEEDNNLFSTAPFQEFIWRHTTWVYRR